MPNVVFPGDDLVWNQLGSPISWYYNYEYTPTTLYGTTLQFVPMLWGNYENSFKQTVTSLIAQGMNITYVLGFNEPDGPGNEGGSNIIPVDAATRWISDIEPLRLQGVLMGGPAVTGSTRGLQWLTDWFTACNGACHVDFLPIHVYGDFRTVQWIVGEFRIRWPGVRLWMTEWADPNQSLSVTQQEWTQSLLYLDSQPDIDKHSYFGAFRSYASNVGYNASMLDSCGNLTDIGAIYTAQTQMHNIPGPDRCPSGLSDIRCPSANGQTYTDPKSGDVFNVQCYTDFYGGDILGSGFITSFSGCIQACADLGNVCAAIVFANRQCFEKLTPLSNPSLNYNVWAAVLSTVSGTNNTLASSLAQISSSESPSAGTISSSAISDPGSSLYSYSNSVPPFVISSSPSVASPSASKAPSSSEASPSASDILLPTDRLCEDVTLLYMVKLLIKLRSCCMGRALLHSTHLTVVYVSSLLPFKI
jgi:hypothetical protein